MLCRSWWARPSSSLRVQLELSPADKWEWRWHRPHCWQPVSGRFVSSVTEPPRHWFLPGSCRQRVSEATNWGWSRAESSTMSRAHSRLLHTWRHPSELNRKTPHCGDIPLSFLSFLLLVCVSRKRRLSPEGRMTPAHLMISSRWKLLRGTTVSSWRLHNSQEFSRIWRRIKSDPCSRWVRQNCNSEVLVYQFHQAPLFCTRMC